MANSSIRDFTKYNRVSGATGAGPFLVDYVVIGGGGGGGGVLGGGGGAGGYLSGSAYSLPAGKHPLAVGAGAPGSSTNPKSMASPSRFGPFYAIGGGTGGTSNDAPGAMGGSGAGTSYNFTISAYLNIGIDSQGNSGGLGRGNTSPFGGGGGGGAGAAGGNAAGNAGGNGGNGLASSITGSAVTRAGGGGAGVRGGTAGTGGTGGGGAGAPSGTATSGTANTGSGGGGSDGTAGAGGSGVVIFALSTYATATFSAGVTQTSTFVGVNRVFTVTEAGPTDTVTIG